MTDFNAYSTEIKLGPHEALSISQDYDDDPGNPQAILLFVPDQEDPDHYHVPLNDTEVAKLRDWCDAFLKRKAG